MAYKIVVTESFEKKTAEISRWLQYKWSVQSAEKFEYKLRLAIQKISINPAIGKISARQNDIRSILITKHNRLYYHVEQQTITILYIFETKQNPQRNKYD